MMRATLAAVAVMIGATMAATPASATQLEPADRDVTRARVTYAETVGVRGVYVELNNGAAYRLRPCRYEDSRSCYWDARSFGNGVGRSFVVVSGRVVRSTMIDGMGGY